MTTDNAIAVLRRMQDPDPFEPQITRVAFDALEMAIQALSAKGDMVYRQAAIDAVIKRDANCGIDSAEVLKILPSVQPEWEELLVICDCCGHAIRVKRQ